MAAATSSSIQNNALEESSSLASSDYDDFPLMDDDDNEGNIDHHQQEEDDYNLQLEESINNAFQLLNLPPTLSSSGVPVGGMRRVSSCYFSIASNISNSNNEYQYANSTYNNQDHGSVFHSPNPSHHNSASIHNYSSHYSSSHSHCYDALSFEGRNASDFLLHDVLMNVFSFLDAHSLASFSETGRRPNFECFYFLELQLQRALLMGEGEGIQNYFGYVNVADVATDEEENMLVDEGDANIGDLNAGGHEFDGANDDREGEANNQDDASVENESNNGDNTSKPKDESNNHKNMIPSFEGAIAGTGVISRLASLNSTMARKIVQTYLDSNTSIQAMPLSHSLAYFRQVLLRQMNPSSTTSAFPGAKSGVGQATATPSFPQPNARNMALFFTFLGAAYMHAHQGGAGDMPTMPAMPDPSEVLNEENMEALKNMMLKVGFGGMFLKAGKTMKEKASELNSNANNRNNDNQPGGEQMGGGDEGVGQQLGSRIVNANNDAQVGEDGYANAEANLDSSANDEIIDGTAGSSSAPKQQAKRQSQQRSSSIGSLEDLSHMIPHPSAIASRLYNAFSSNNTLPTTDSPNSSTADLAEDQKVTDDGDGQEPRSTSSPKRQHRSKRSHKTLRHQDMGVDDTNHVFEEEKKTSEPEIRQERKVLDPVLSPEEIAFAMDHPFSPNPYDHPSSFCSDDGTNADKNGNPLNSDNDPAAVGVAGTSETTSSFFSFNMKPLQDPMFSNGNNVVPTGCIGAYAHAVKSAASEVTRLIKAERKANYDSLPPDEQHELGMRFIDACTSDDTLDIVKEILQKQKMMDVDRFFIGPDDTETCALHAAAFNGAEKVLQFLCGGIDENDPGEDCGLCDVNVRDANGWTALHFAAGSNSVTSVRVLSNHGAKLTIEASNGYTPFHWAERLSNEEVAGELERLGADNRFVGRWMFGNRAAGDDRKIPFVSFLANRFFAFSGR